MEDAGREELGQFQQFLQQAISEQGISQQHQGIGKTFNTVVPNPGFCIKTKTDKNEKVFLNVCTSDSLPAPKAITEDELISHLQSESPSDYRVPLSLGEPHAELDKSGQGCTAYDVIIHPEFHAKCQSSDIFMGFLLTVTLEGIEDKYDLKLDRNYKILKNKKFIGTLPEQNVKTQPTPLIREVDGSSPTKSLISEISSTIQAPKVSNVPEPQFTIVQDPVKGKPEFLVMEILLPKVKSAKTLMLDLGEDRILLQTRSDVYYLDKYIPFDVVQSECGAQFNKKTRTLTITMPVVNK